MNEEEKKLDDVIKLCETWKGYNGIYGTLLFAISVIFWLVLI